MKKYAFFGGSFNPPTYAHLEIAKITLAKMKLDKFFFVPVGNNYNKKGLIDEHERCKMLNILSENENNIVVEDIELNKDKELTTYEALKNIQQKYDNSKNYYIMGADNILKLSRAQNVEDMLNKYQFIIFERENIDIKKEIEENLILKKYEDKFQFYKLDKNRQCSSRKLRKLIEEKKFEEAEKYTDRRIIDSFSTKPLEKNIKSIYNEHAN